MTDIITITEADLARLQSWEFEEVWRAVGYVYRRRAQAPAIEPAPVPLAPVEAPPVVPPGRAPGETEGADYSAEIPDAGQASDFPASDDAPKSEPGEFTCPDCGQVFARAQGLASHRSIRHGVKGQDVHANRPRATTDPACPECGKVCKPNGIGTHRRIAHGAGQAMGTCEDCGLTMPFGSLARHRASRHAVAERAEVAPAAAPEPWPYTCEVCGYEAPGPSTLEVHQQTCRIHPALDQSGSMPTSGPLVPSREQRAETFVIEPAPIGDASLPEHVHRYELGRPEGGVVVGVCECGHRKLHPADLNGDISRNGKRSPNPKCPRCGKHALRDRHGYWCNGCQLEVLAS